MPFTVRAFLGRPHESLRTGTSCWFEGKPDPDADFVEISGKGRDGLLRQGRLKLQDFVRFEPAHFPSGRPQDERRLKFSTRKEAEIFAELLAYARRLAPPVGTQPNHDAEWMRRSYKPIGDGG